MTEDRFCTQCGRALEVSPCGFHVVAIELPPPDVYIFGMLAFAILACALTEATTPRPDR